MRPLIVLLTLSVGLASFGRAQDKRTILAVLAHPDDETSVGPVLAKYAAAGHDVHLALLTSGQAGSMHTDIPSGPELGRVREAEASCATEALGIHEPLMLGFQDGETTAWRTQDEIARKLAEVFDEVEPDVVITWGPDGLTGHPDHRVASNVTTQVFQDLDSWPEGPSKLYYVAWPAKFAQRGMRTVSERHITTTIDAGGFGERAATAIRCHKTQWSPERMEQMIGMGEQVLQWKIRLRLALSDSSKPLAEDDILAGLGN